VDSLVINESMNIRIIPRLDIKGPNLVKGIHFEGLRVLGKPEEFAGFYYRNGADELFYQDAVASLYGRNSLLEIIRRTSKNIFIPLCVGGGLRTIGDVRDVLRAGADKVAINTAAIKSPDLIKASAETFGSSTIVASIEAVKNRNDMYEACIDYGRELTGQDAVKWAENAAELGAGELLITSIDREGTGKGYDIELIKQIAESVSVPVIAGGGCGCLEHLSDVIDSAKANAVSLASSLHYHAVGSGAISHDETLFQEEGNTVFMKSGRRCTNIKTFSILEAKNYMRNNGIQCRNEVTL